MTLRTAALLGVALCLAAPARAQQAPLTVQQIMQDPDTWIGAWPSDPFWSEDGAWLYFSWNPDGSFPSDSLYRVPRDGGDPEQVPTGETYTPPARFTGWHHGEFVYDAAFERKVYDAGDDLFLYDRTTGEATRLTRTRERESDPRFTPDGQAVVFVRNDNLFELDLATGTVTQRTDLREGDAPDDEKTDDQQAFLEAQQEELFEIIRRRKEEAEAREAAEERAERARYPMPTYYYGRKSVQGLSLDPAERFVAFSLAEPPSDPRRTSVQDYVTESGFADERNARPKVGSPDGTSALYIQDLERDTTYQIDLTQLDGAYDVPAYRQELGVEVDSTKARVLSAQNLLWYPDGGQAVIEVFAEDHKDRWIARLDPASGELTVLDRQTDEAWIGGPGISWYGGHTWGWLADGRLYFQSEATGYSHLYVMDVETGETEQLTDGDFEVFQPMLSRDGSTWYFTSSQESPFERHFYSMPIDGDDPTRLTTLTGGNQADLNPDEQTLGLLYSYSNRPPEIYIQPTGEEPVQITHSTTEAWKAYAWRDPEIIHFEASDGVEVPARIYEPETPNGGAVLFVHGAGYLQNVHRWWSSYFREYMFHNLLVERGYLVLDVDYRASSGYGRDWRTAIYRYMGGRDLQDYVDASRYAAETYDIDPERVFVYGGSYGGFITLMALFTEPEHFGGGAALRSVTDWAHYNHGYTSNILNTPATDTLAFTRSSPIYFAEGLEDPLLIAHGMVDTNVHFQDVVRLAQRLIELGKEDWEMAVYPIEDHGFTEPESWTDEYRRILELIQETVGPNRMQDTETAAPANGRR